MRQRRNLYKVYTNTCNFILNVVQGTYVVTNVDLMIYLVSMAQPKTFLKKPLFFFVGYSV